MLNALLHPKAELLQEGIFFCSSTYLHDKFCYYKKLEIEETKTSIQLLKLIHIIKVGLVF